MRGIELSGRFAYLLWRSVYLTKQVSARNRFLILIDWLKTRVFGRDISQASCPLMPPHACSCLLRHLLTSSERFLMSALRLRARSCEEGPPLHDVSPREVSGMSPLGRSGCRALTPSQPMR